MCMATLCHCAWARCNIILQIRHDLDFGQFLSGSMKWTFARKHQFLCNNSKWFLDALVIIITLVDNPMEGENRTVRGEWPTVVV
jgi:hypothetical protein